MMTIYLNVKSPLSLQELLSFTQDLGKPSIAFPPKDSPEFLRGCVLRCSTVFGFFYYSPIRLQPELNTFSGNLRCGGIAKHTDYQELFYPGK